MLFFLKQGLLILLTATFLNGQGHTFDSQVDSSNVKNPSTALLLSLVPGGGQLYTRHSLKALLFAGIFVYYGYEYGNAQQAYENDLASQSLHRSRNDKIWMMGLIWSLNLLDAYVDSQLWDFEKYEIDDGSTDSGTEPSQLKITGNTNVTE